MKSKQSVEPQVSIHVTNSVRTSGGEINARGKRPGKSHKRKREVQDRGSENQAQALASQKDPEPHERTASFRHLFSFGAGKDEGAKLRTVPEQEGQGASFSLFGSDFARGGDEMRDLPLERQNNVAHTNTNASDEEVPEQYPDESFHEFGLDGDGDVMDEDLEHIGKVAPPGGQGLIAPNKGRGSVNVVPETLDTSERGIHLMAMQFCRQQTMEELEAEWSGPGGIREQMRRDFKQKRRNSIRERRLGSTPNRG